MHPKTILSIIRRRQCGVGSFRPQCLQRFACIEGYCGLLGIFAICSGIFPMYTISQVTSIEKHFHLSSQQAGLLVGSSEFGFLTTSLLIGHFLSTSHRPRILSVCLLAMGLGSLLMTAPGLNHVVNNVGDEKGLKLERSERLCDSGRMNTTCAVGTGEASEDTAVYYTLVMGMVLNGIGSSCLWTLGIAYIDDNTSKTKSPRYIGAVMCIRLLSPVIGIAMGSGVASIPVHLRGEADDIGCWWIGYLPITLLSIIGSVGLFLFPEELSIPEEVQKNVQKDRKRSLFDPETLARRRSRAEIRKTSGEKATRTRGNSLRRMSTVAAETVADAAITATVLLKTFPAAIWRLAKNPAFIFLCLSLTIDIAIGTGYIVFVPKYLENIFHLSSMYANIIVGISAPLAGAFGTLLGGILVSVVKVRLNKQILVVILVTIVCYCLQPLLLFVKCQVEPVQGLVGSNLTESFCSGTCQCDTNMLKTICGSDGKTYFSPCHAGCTGLAEAGYTGCSCISAPSTAYSGHCTSNCEAMSIVYAAVLTIVVIVASMASMPLMMLILRCVEPRDKSLGLAVFNVVVSIGMMPTPGLFGTLIDQTCIIHKTSSCNASAPGACTYYDSGRLRQAIHVIQYLRLLAPLLLSITWYTTRRTVFEGDEHLQAGKNATPAVDNPAFRKSDVALEDVKEEEEEEESVEKHDDNNSVEPEFSSRL